MTNQNVNDKDTTEGVKTAREIWESRNPQHECGDDGKDLFWKTMEMCMEEYSQQQNKYLKSQLEIYKAIAKTNKSECEFMDKQLKELKKDVGKDGLMSLYLSIKEENNLLTDKVEKLQEENEKLKEMIQLDNSLLKELEKQISLLNNLHPNEADQNQY